MFTAVFHRSFRYCALALIFAGSVFAQSEEHPATVGIAGGLTTVVGHDAGRLDHGGNIQVSGGYFFTHNLGITAAFQFSNLGITGSELARLNEPDGSARAYTLTFDPTVRFSLGHGMTGYLLGGAVLIETVFNLNGIGQYAVQSITTADYAPIQGFVLVAAVFTMMVYLIVDLLQFMIDPRVSARAS